MNNLLYILINLNAFATNTANQPAGAAQPAHVFNVLSTILLVCLLLTIILWVYVFASKKVAARRHEEFQAESQFERDVLSTVNLNQKLPQRHQPDAAIKNNSTPESSNWLQSSREKLISRLIEANLFDSDEGDCKLNGCPQPSRIVRLKDKRLALIIPYDNSTDFVKNSLKRFDIFFLILGQNQTAVVQKYQDFIVEKISFG